MNDSCSVTSMKEIYRRFKENITRYKMIRSGDRVLLSMSAGKDSMALFHLIELLKKEINFETGIFHLNHLIRGENSDNDELLLRDLSAEHGIPLHCIRHDFNSIKTDGLSFEESARNIRYSLIKEICEKHGYNKTATAHNFNDNAETVLMRIFSGTGIRGLGGINIFSNRIIRPLMIFTADELYKYLNDGGVSWREDESNRDEKYLRNYLRNTIFPLVVNRFPDAVRNINRLSDHARENEELLDSMVFEKYGAFCETGEGLVKIFMDRLPDDVSIIKFILSRSIYRTFGEKISHGVTEEILKKYRSRGSNLILYENPRIVIEKIFLNNEKFLLVYDTKEKRDPLNDWSYSVNIDSVSTVFIEEIKRKISFEKVDNIFFEENMLNRGYIFISLPENCNSIIIRNRRRGDRILLENGVKKIKEIMIEKKLDTFSKSIVPLIEVENSIAAFLPGIAGLHGNRVSCSFKVQGNSKKIIAINSAVFTLI